MADITLQDLTSGKACGSGVFDVLMAACKEHIDKEYGANRIKGPDYATVYLGAMVQVLQTSVEFLLQKDKAAREAELVAAQILLAEAQKDEVEARTALVTQQTANAVIEGQNLVKQGQLLDENLERVAAETALLEQKRLTELAQIEATGVDEDSVIGRQKDLYLAQTEGFYRNAEQQATKIMVDTWNVRRTTDEGVSANSTNNLEDSSVGAAVEKLMEGIGVTL